MSRVTNEEAIKTAKTVVQLTEEGHVSTKILVTTIGLLVTQLEAAERSRLQVKNVLRNSWMYGNPSPSTKALILMLRAEVDRA